MEFMLFEHSGSGMQLLLPTSALDDMPPPCPHVLAIAIRESDLRALLHAHDVSRVPTQARR